MNQIQMSISMTENLLVVAVDVVVDVVLVVDAVPTKNMYI
jgi:hypothetical protein